MQECRCVSLVVLSPEIVVSTDKMNTGRTCHCRIGQLHGKSAEHPAEVRGAVYGREIYKGWSCPSDGFVPLMISVHMLLADTLR